MFKNVLSILLFSLLLIYGCSTTPTKTDSVRPVKLYKTESLGRINKDFAGMSVAEEIAELAFRVSGQLILLDIEDGRSVDKGFLIARLDPRDFQYKEDAARSVMVSAKARFERMGRLLKHQAVSTQDFEIAQTQYEESKSAFENAQGALEDTRLYAPFSGNIEKTYMNNYQRATAGEPVVRLVSPRTAKVRFTMPDNSLSLLSLPDMKLSVAFDNYPDVLFSAYLHEYVSSSSDATGIPVTIILDDSRVNNGKYKITPGMSCNINMKIENKSREGMTAVPVNAIYSPAAGGTMVWVCDADGVVRTQSVELGDIFGSDMVTVKSGLAPDTEVVSAGVYRLSEGEKVKVLK